MLFRTPLLVQIEPWEQYLEHVSKRARREYRLAIRAHADARYREVPLERTQLQHWMWLWEQQMVEGRHPRWSYTAERFEREHWRLFDVGVGVHPLLICGDYCYAGPPLYDKVAHPYAAKLMWFGAIRWCTENAIKWLDLQGPGRMTWRALLEQPNRSYKWLYVPQASRAVALAQPWYSQCCPCGWRQLVEHETVCRGCGAS